MTRRRQADEWMSETARSPTWTSETERPAVFTVRGQCVRRWNLVRVRSPHEIRIHERPDEDSPNPDREDIPQRTRPQYRNGHQNGDAEQHEQPAADAMGSNPGSLAGERPGRANPDKPVRPQLTAD